MKKIWVSLFFILPVSLFSQTSKKEKTLTNDEIKFKQCSFDPEASAVVLSDYTEYWFDTNPNGKNLFLFVRQRLRIKILTEEGLKYAKIKIAYHNMHCEELFGENTFTIKGLTHTIDSDGKIKKTKLKNKNITYRDSLKCTSFAEFEMPEVKVGSIIEYTVTRPTLELEKPSTRYLQYDIPVLFSQTVFDVPRYFEYLFSSESMADMETDTQKDYNKVIVYPSQIYYGGGRVRQINETIDLSGTSFLFEISNIPSFKAEKKLFSDNTYRKKISFHLKTLRNDNLAYGWKSLTYNLFNTLSPDYDRLTPGQRKMHPYPAGFYAYNLPTWEELNQSLLNSDKFGLALVKFWDCKSLIDSLTGGLTDDSLKVMNIYNYVRNAIKWNKHYDIYADVSDNIFKKLYAKAGGSVKYNNIGKLVQDTTATSGVINFMMMYLLRKANILVNPVLISTPGNGKIDENIPDVNQFNNTIAEVKINGKFYYLDAAIPDETFYIPYGNTEKRSGFKVEPDKFGILNYNFPFIIPLN